MPRGLNIRSLFSIFWLVPTDPFADPGRGEHSKESNEDGSVWRGTGFAASPVAALSSVLA